MVNISNRIITYTPYDNFVKLTGVKGCREIGRPGFYSFQDRVTSKMPLYTRDANTCSILSINDTLVHLAPEREECYLIDKIADFVKQQKDCSEKVTAFLLGGKIKQFSKLSEELFTGIANILEKENTDYSMLCGKNMDIFKDHLLKMNDRFIFSQQYNVGLEELMADKSLTQKDMKNILKYYYDYVKISPNHKIEVL